MGLVIDVEKYLVTRDERQIELPRKEFELIKLLCSVPGKVYSRQIIFKKIWGGKSNTNERTVDVHISNVRKKLGEDIIRTIKGVGYKIILSESEIVNN
jgi:two-component system, OmpR family, alkaline phosphatase synthesis response regulator PhoP